MSGTQIVSLLGFIGMVLASRGGAQEPWIGQGTRVRVSQNRGRLTGTVLALAGDTLRLLPERRTDTVGVPLGGIRRVELRRRRSVAGGAALGGYLGMMLGGTTMLVIAGVEHCLAFDFSSYSPTHCPSDRTAVAVICGSAVAGAIIGSLVRGERWVRVPLSRLQASLGPHGVRITIGF